MQSRVNWENPYADREGNWLKGNLHTHTYDGGIDAIPAKDGVDGYVKKGYDFLAITDHMRYTVHDDNRLTFIHGFEWNSDTSDYHTGVYSLNPERLHQALKITDHDEMLELLSGDDTLIILNHPNRHLEPDFTRQELASKNGFDGIEVFNSLSRRQEGGAISSIKWDYILTKGKRVLGFANDDMHQKREIGVAANYVRVKSNTPRDIFQALKVGNFYCSTGVVIEDIRREEDVITVETTEAEEIHVVSQGGRMIETRKDHSLQYIVSEPAESYVRFELYGKGSEMAWTQPFFLN